MKVDALIKNTNVKSCIECGKCTSNCPVSRFNHQFSPRLLLSTFFQNSSDHFLEDDRIWSCLTCGMCQVRCPSDVQFSEFIKRVRKEAFTNGREATCSHGGALQSLMKIMISENLKQNRLEWLTDDLKIADTSETLFFVGCAPYFDVFFTELEINSLAPVKSSIHLLNSMGIEPVLLKNERCCGHDLLWSGDLEHYQRLAQENINEINKIKPKRVVFSCAECYRTFKIDYPALLGPLDFEMVHITEFLDKNLGDRIRFHEHEVSVTYQDPCRLGRHMGIYDAPRNVMNAIPGLQLLEMQKNRQNAMCCGTNSWINCDTYSRMIQHDRLQTAKKTGAEYLITSCPKCYIHFTCAMQGDYPEKINIKDIAVLAAEAMES